MRWPKMLRYKQNNVNVKEWGGGLNFVFFTRNEVDSVQNKIEN